MKASSLLLLAACFVSCAAAPNDIQMTQRNAANSAWIGVTLPGTPGYIIGTSGSGILTMLNPSGFLVIMQTLTTSGTLSAPFNYVVINSAAPTTQNLPASPAAGQQFVVKNIGTGMVTLSGNGKMIDGFTSLALPQWLNYTVTWDAADNLWLIGN